MLFQTHKVYRKEDGLIKTFFEGFVIEFYIKLKLVLYA